MAKEQASIGNIDATTPVGSIFTMDGGEQYTLTRHQTGDKEGLVLAGIGCASELDGFHGYAEWNEDYAPFVTEIKYPEPTTVPAAQFDTVPSNPENPMLGIQGPEPVSVPASTMDAVEEARDRFRESEATYDSLNEQAKAAKKEMDADQEALNRAIDAMLDGELVRADGWPKNAPLAAVADEAPAGDWQQVELADLADPHIKVGVLKVLAENGINTMGQLAEWQKEKGDFWAKDLKGIGKAACDSIAAATDAYWMKNPRPVPDEPFAPAAEESHNADE
jgi:hypothetical protein